MVSLTVLLVVAMGVVFAQGVAMATAARAVGSPRGRLGPALVAAAVLFAVGLGSAAAYATIDDQLTPAPPTSTARSPRSAPSVADADEQARVAALQRAAAVGALALVQLAVGFAIVRRTFRLSVGRTFAPWGSMLAVSVAAVAVQYGLVRPYVAEAFVIPTRSMAPTLEARDHFLVGKWSARHLRRWDVVAYHNPTDGSVYCKRVIGLPGETIRFDGDGGLTVNGVAVDVPPPLAGRLHATSATPGVRSRYADGDAIPLGGRQLFLVGDNVDLSWDSRMAGPSDVGAVVGVADLIYWPPGRARLLR